MIIITLAGNSSRFFKNGYNTVKYKLPLGNSNVIGEIIKSLPIDEKIVFVLNFKYSDKIWLTNVLNSSLIKDWIIIEVNDTKGQLETVKLALDLIKADIYNTSYLTIYNGDTIRNLTNWNKFNGDGYIEVFESSGDHWSFVDNLGIVKIVKEKEKISTYCSSGFYYFKSVLIFLSNYDEYVKDLNHELFVAPFFQFLIDKNYIITSSLTSISNFEFCGTPFEYENTRKKYV